jgi:sulfoxide reductase heme-binding subunit YedZ
MSAKVILGKPIVFIVCLIPAVYLLVLALTGQLGPDTGKALVLETGGWALRLLLVTLAVTPLRRWTNIAGLVRYRRMLGLYTWFYASIHMMAVMTYLLGWNWVIFLEEFAERPYMALGIVAWLLMLPLGVSSNHWAQRRLGKRWKPLHQLIYLIGILACAHFVWLVRADLAEALVYCAVLALLLGARLITKVQRGRRLSKLPAA